jgi:quercetin dioxygenase-like cupin family protein
MEEKMKENAITKSEKLRFKELVDYSDGSIVSKLILKKEAGNITLFSFDKGQSLSEHTAPFDAVVQIVEGSAEILIDGKSYLLDENETIIMPADIPHAVKAPEKFKMLLTMIKSKQ